MDSAPAIANLINGGGPKQDLCDLIKTIWGFFQSLDINPSSDGFVEIG
jgi:hypothetical protein